MLWTRSVSGFPILEYLHIYIVRCFGEGDPSLNTEFIYVLYTPFTHNLKVLCAAFVVHLCFECACHMRSYVESSICGITFTVKKFWTSEHFRFWVFRLGIQAVKQYNVKHDNIFPYVFAKYEISKNLPMDLKGVFKLLN